MRVEVLLFGAEAHAAGRRAVTAEVDADPVTCGALRRALAETAPSLAPYLEWCRFAVDHTFVTDDRVIAGGEEVALIGAVSGG